MSVSPAHQNSQERIAESSARATAQHAPATLLACPEKTLFVYMIATLTILLLAFPGRVSADLFKCEHPDGHITYQQTACDDEGMTGGAPIDVDTRGPDGTRGSSPTGEFSVENQLRQFEESHRRSGSGTAGKERKSSEKTSYDAAKCARSRAQAAKWAKEARTTYRDRSEQVHREQMLEYHQVLVDRYCQPRTPED